MTERTITTPLMDVLKLLYPRSVVIKHSDRFTSGIPDLTITVNGITTWFEVKYVRRGETLREVAQRKPQQLFMARLLWRAAPGRCWYIAYFQDPKEVRLVRPDAIAKRADGEADADHVSQGFDHRIVEKVIAA